MAEVGTVDPPITSQRWLMGSSLSLRAGEDEKTRACLARYRILRSLLFLNRDSQPRTRVRYHNLESGINDRGEYNVP